LFRDVQGAVVQHCGGEQHVSETQRLAIRRVAALEAELIYLEDNFACERTAGNVPIRKTLRCTPRWQTRSADSAKRWAGVPSNAT